jgi:hypothetical protein
MTSTENEADLGLVADAAKDLRGMCSEHGYREAVAVLVDAVPALVAENEQLRAQRQAVLDYLDEITDVHPPMLIRASIRAALGMSS